MQQTVERRDVTVTIERVQHVQPARGRPFERSAFEAELALEHALRHRAHDRSLRRAVFEEDHVRDRLDPVPDREILVLVDVHLHELEVPLLRDPLEYRRDRELIANAVPKSDYYVTSPDGKRMVSLELQRLTLSFIASSSDRDRARVDELIAQNPVGWQADWLEERGLSDWAKVYLDLAGANEVYV